MFLLILYWYVSMFVARLLYVSIRNIVESPEFASVKSAALLGVFIKYGLMTTFFVLVYDHIPDL